MDMFTLVLAKNYADEVANQAVLAVLSGLPLLNFATLDEVILG